MGFFIKAFVVRFRQLGVIDDAQARSLCKQISARKRNKSEPLEVGNESAVWFAKVIGNSTRRVTSETGLGEAYFRRWVDWSPRELKSAGAVMSVMPPFRHTRDETVEGSLAPVTQLPVANGR